MSTKTASALIFGGGRDDDRLSGLLVRIVGATLLIAAVVPWIPVPEIDRAERERIPPQLAEIILAKSKPVEPQPVVAPDPIPEPEPEEKIPRPKPVEEALPEAPKPQTVKQAREKANVAGLLAFKDEFRDLREAVDVASLQDTANIQRGAGEAATVERSILTASAGERRANVNVAALSRETGGVALAGRETTVVEAPPDEKIEQTGARRLTPKPIDSHRSIEEIRRVFDANKGAIYSIYNRALRKNPGLLGKVVLELVILPNGQVSDCEVVSTELSDDEMMEKIRRRVQLFDFGDKDVAVTRISYPVHFLPT